MTRHDYPEKLVGEYLQESSPDYIDLIQGVSVGDAWGTPEFEFEVSNEVLSGYDELVNSTLVPLVSERISEFFRSHCSDLVELIPAKLNTKNGQLNGYSLVNIRNLGRSVDAERSEYLYFPDSDWIMKFTELEFLDSPDPRMITREQIYISYVVVTEEFKKARDENRWRGVALFRADEIKP